MEGFELVDSGGGRKLERYGTRLLDRASSTAIWNRSKAKLWEGADASFAEGKEWSFKAAPFESWNISLLGIQFALHLQRNGQVGIFPEHLSYAEKLLILLRASAKRPNLGRPVRVLNLFAYTGLASLLSMREMAHVTHVDNSKRVLEWFNENIALNGFDQNLVKLIPEDALLYAEREVRRESSYDIIILDPPSFSRVSKSKSWDLEDVIIELTHLCSKLLSKEGGAIIFTSHHPVLGGEVVLNVFKDIFAQVPNQAEVFPLYLQENETGRKIPSGSGVILKVGVAAND